jgi:hypothetical protein
MSTDREVDTATLLTNGKVLVAGGESHDNAALSSAELYDPSTGIWSTNGSMITGRQVHTATLLPNGKVLAAGGWNNSSLYLSSAELYTPSPSNVNVPPTTSPVYVTNESSSTPTINWTYSDANGDAQVQFEVEVLTQPNGDVPPSIVPVVKLEPAQAAGWPREPVDDISESCEA